MNIGVESFWNDPIENVFVEGQIIGHDISFKTPSVNLAPWENRGLYGHFDTSTIEEEEFQIKLTVHYSEKTTEKTVDVRFKKETPNYLLIGVIAGAVVLTILIIILVVWIVKLRKETRKNGKKK